MGHSPFQSRLDPAKVLVIDPSERTRSLYRETLGGEDCELLFADDGFDALSKIDDWQPTLVFAASNMPRLDGYKLSEIMKNNRRCRTVPVVLVSHDADMFELAKGRLVGAREHVLYPLTPEVILGVFNRLG